MSGCKKTLLIPSLRSQDTSVIKSWLFVLINTKIVQLRTAFPFSFWLYIAFHIASQCKQ